MSTSYTTGEPLYFKGEISKNALTVLEKSEKFHKESETHRSITPPNYLLISCIVFKWEPFENLKWRVNVIDRKDKVNLGYVWYLVFSMGRIPMAGGIERACYTVCSA